METRRRPPPPAPDHDAKFPDSIKLCRGQQPWGVNYSIDP